MAFQVWLETRKETDEARDKMIECRTAFESRRNNAMKEVETLKEKDHIALHQAHVISQVEAALLPSARPMLTAHRHFVVKRREEEEALNAYRVLSSQLIPTPVDFYYDD